MIAEPWTSKFTSYVHDWIFWLKPHDFYNCSPFCDDFWWNPMIPSIAKYHHISVVPSFTGRKWWKSVPGEFEVHRVTWLRCLLFLFRQVSKDHQSITLTLTASHSRKKEVSGFPECPLLQKDSLIHLTDYTDKSLTDTGWFTHWYSRWKTLGMKKWNIHSSPSQDNDIF